MPNMNESKETSARVDSVLPLLDTGRLWGFYPPKGVPACLISYAACKGFLRPRLNPEESSEGGAESLQAVERAGRGGWGQRRAVAKAVGAESSTRPRRFPWEIESRVNPACCRVQQRGIVGFVGAGASLLKPRVCHFPT